MEYVTTALQVISLIIIGWFIKSYFPSYLNEKGKNLATKEDIESITAIIEQTRLRYTMELEQTKSALQADLEKLKADLGQYSEAIAKKREVYHQIVKSLSVFISGRRFSQDEKKKFLDDYSTLWLWAQDDVIRAINTILDLMVRVAERPDSVTQSELKRTYAEFLLRMRKDSGHLESTLNYSEYRFVSFGA